MALYAALNPGFEEEGEDAEVAFSTPRPSLPSQTSPQTSPPTQAKTECELTTSRRHLFPCPSDPAMPGVWGHLVIKGRPFELDVNKLPMRFSVKTAGSTPSRS